jgi:hypothetical protein
MYSTVGAAIGRRRAPIENGTKRNSIARVRLAILIAVMASAVTFAAGARAGTWYQQYLWEHTLCGICVAESSSNQSLSFNDTQWSTSGSNGTAHAYLSLCDANNSCYSPATQSGGYGTDSRTISYGEAVCFPQNSPTYQVWFEFCDVDNY